MNLPGTLVRKLINNKVPLTMALEKLETGHTYQAGRTCFCPFHDNTNTPAAAIFAGDDHDSLWCFAEQKQYNSVDVIEKLLHKDIYALAEAIWQGMDSAEQEAFITTHNEVDLVQVFSTEPKIEPTKELKRLEAQYRSNKISAQDLLLGILRASQGGPSNE